MITRCLSLALVCCSLAFQAAGQESLEAMVKEGKAEWMFGKWQAETDSGTATLAISWDLDKHVVLLHLKTSDMESKGYTSKDPQSESIGYVSFDNRGSTSTGKWAMESDELVLRVDVKSPDRTWKMAAVFTGSESKGLQVRVHRVDDSGELESPARTELKFKKQK